MPATQRSRSAAAPEPDDELGRARRASSYRALLLASIEPDVSGSSSALRELRARGDEAGSGAVFLAVLEEVLARQPRRVGLLLNSARRFHVEDCTALREALWRIAREAPDPALRANVENVLALNLLDLDAARAVAARFDEPSRRADALYAMQLLGADATRHAIEPLLAARADDEALWDDVRVAGLAITDRAAVELFLELRDRATGAARDALTSALSGARVWDEVAADADATTRRRLTALRDEAYRTDEALHDALVAALGRGRA